VATDVLNEVLAARKQLRQAPYYATALVVGPKPSQSFSPQVSPGLLLKHAAIAHSSY